MKIFSSFFLIFILFIFLFSFFVIFIFIFLFSTFLVYGSSSFFNDILVVFVCLSLVSDFLFSKYLISFIRKCLYFFLQLHSNCVCKPIIVSVKIATKSSNFTDFLWISIILSDICYTKFFRFIRKYLHFHFKLYYYFLYAYHCICEIYDKNFQMLPFSNEFP